jgi:hypothetical protein
MVKLNLLKRIVFHTFYTKSSIDNFVSLHSTNIYIFHTKKNFFFKYKKVCESSVESERVLFWTRLLDLTKPNVTSIGPIPHPLAYIYNHHKPHKVCIILTSTFTSSLYWLGHQSVICRYPHFFESRSSPCSESDL